MISFFPFFAPFLDDEKCCRNCVDYGAATIVSAGQKWAQLEKKYFHSEWTSDTNIWLTGGVSVCVFFFWSPGCEVLKELCRWWGSNLSRGYSNLRLCVPRSLFKTNEEVPMSMTRYDINRPWTTIRIQHNGYEHRTEKGVQYLIDGNYFAPAFNTEDAFYLDRTPWELIITW